MNNQLVVDLAKHGSTRIVDIVDQTLNLPIEPLEAMSAVLMMYHDFTGLIAIMLHKYKAAGSSADPYETMLNMLALIKDDLRAHRAEYEAAISAQVKTSP